MLLKPYFLILVCSLLVTSFVSGVENTEIEKLPPSGEGIVFPHYLLMKVSDRTNFFEYDKDTDERILNFNQLIVKKLKSIPDVFYDRIPAISIIKKEIVYFKSQIKNDYNYSDKWTDKNHIISIRDFEKTGYDSDLSTYLGSLSKIPTSSHGLATYDLKFDGNIVSFKSYASKKFFSLKKKYWVYFDVYLPPQKYANQFKLLILTVSEPNNYLKDNGTYFLVPINEDDRKRYSIQ